MELHPPLHLGVVAIEKEVFRSPSADVQKIYKEDLALNTNKGCYVIKSD